MSTKTSIKRIALVAVAALGFGMVSTVSARAEGAAAVTNSISLAQVTAAPTINSAVTVNFLANVDDYTNIAADTTHTYVGYLSSYPSGGFTQVSATADVAGITDTELWVGPDGTEVDESVSGASFIAVIDSDANTDDFTGNTLTASATRGAASFTFTPTVAGTYVLSVFNDAGTLDGAINIGEAVQTISLTVAGVAGFSQVLSTSILDDANSFDATADEEVRVSKTAGTNGSSIEVTLLDVNGNAYYGARVQADVSGPGYVDVVTGASDSYADATARTDYLDLAANANTADIHVTADGTSGTSTITITIKDPVTLAVLGKFTETMYFYGTVASLTAKNNFNITNASADTAIGCSNATGCISDGTGAETPFVLIVAKDAEGNLVPGLTVTAKITDLSVVAASTVATVTAKASATTAGVTTDLNGLGYYNADVRGNELATSGSKTTIVYRTLLADGVTYVTSNAVDVSIGGAVYTTAISFDKATYEPGEAMVVTITAKDSAGNPVYDTAASPTVSFNKAVGGASQTIAAGEYNAGKVATSATRPSIFAPVAAGEFFARASAKVAGVTSQLTSAATVTTAGSANQETAQSAVDAANEATDAANAAADAANAAAEAADAATAAAQDAQAAVAALATQVSTLMAGIKAQITSLTNLVIKIQKKVRA